MTSQAPIVTLTMNPALDVSSTVDRVVPERKLRCGPCGFDPGGGGVNVSRAIRNLGGESLAVYALGGPTGEAYRHFVEREGVTGHEVAIAANTRESFTIDESSTGRQYRFVLQGPTVTEPEWRACLAAVSAHLPRGGFIVASGSLPPGVPVDFYARLAHISSQAEVRLVLDASGPALTEALDVGVFLIKPSRDELAELVGGGSDIDEHALLDASRLLVTSRQADVVALSLGRDGAALITRSATLRLAAPRVDAVSAVGAGDAFVAGLVLRLAQGRRIEDALHTAVAAGSATAALAATGICRADEVARLETQIAHA